MSDEIYLTLETGAFCCIQDELGYFKTAPGRYDYHFVRGKTEKEVAVAMVNRIVEGVQNCNWEADGYQIRFLWFKDPVDYQGNHTGKYEFNHLREAVIAHEYAKHLGTWVNGNTGNKMDGWMLVIPVEKSDDND